MRGNLVTRCYEYDDASLTRCYGATFDAVGNPTSLTDPEGTDVVAVDNLDRLSSVTRQVSGQPDAVESYAHNAMGALSVNAGVAMDHQRPALSNGQLTDAAVPASWNGQPVVLDAGGRITAFGGATLAYNRRNQLVQVTDGTSEEYYDYDVWGRRIGVIHGDNSGDFYVHEGANVEAILHANPGTNAWTTDFQLLYDGIDHPLRVNASGTVAYYELDVIGNVRRLRGVGGTDLGGYRYTAFGKLVEATATIEQPLRWQGRLYTELAGGMYDVRAREWSPELAVFASADEFQYLTTRGTLWGWPLGNPVRWRDPSGRMREGSYPPGYTSGMNDQQLESFREAQVNGGFAALGIAGLFALGEALPGEAYLVMAALSTTQIKSSKDWGGHLQAGLFLAGAFGKIRCPVVGEGGVVPGSAGAAAASSDASIAAHAARHWPNLSREQLIAKIGQVRETGTTIIAANGNT